MRIHPLVEFQHPHPRGSVRKLGAYRQPQEAVAKLKHTNQSVLYRIFSDSHSPNPVVTPMEETVTCIVHNVIKSVTILMLRL